MNTRRNAGWLMTGVAALTSLAGVAAQAHVVVMPDTAHAGRPLRVIFLVAEGCAGSPTTEVRIEFPTEVRFVKPQPKPGWTVELTHERSARAGIDVSAERVSAITWRGGPVPDDHYEEFAVLIQPPSAAGPVYFPTTQICEKGQTLWKETPTTQSAQDGMEHPAPVLKVERAPAKP